MKAAQVILLTFEKIFWINFTMRVEQEYAYGAWMGLTPLACVQECWQLYKIFVILPVAKFDCSLSAIIGHTFAKPIHGNFLSWKHCTNASKRYIFTFTRSSLDTELLILSEPDSAGRALNINKKHFKTHTVSKKENKTYEESLHSLIRISNKYFHWKLVK